MSFAQLGAEGFGFGSFGGALSVGSLVALGAGVVAEPVGLGDAEVGEPVGLGDEVAEPVGVPAAVVPAGLAAAEVVPAASSVGSIDAAAEPVGAATFEAATPAGVYPGSAEGSEVDRLRTVAAGSLNPGAAAGVATLIAAPPINERVNRTPVAVAGRMLRR